MHVSCCTFVLLLIRIARFCGCGGPTLFFWGGAECTTSSRYTSRSQAASSARQYMAQGSQAGQKHAHVSKSAKAYAAGHLHRSKPRTESEPVVIRQFPVLPFLVFLLEFLVFFPPARNSFFFSSVFPFFSRDFRGSAGIKNPCSLRWFSVPFSNKKQGKEDHKAIATRKHMINSAW